MRSVISIILTGLVSLVVAAEGFPSSIQAAASSSQGMEPSFYDGPCSSESDALCHLSKKSSVTSVSEERIVGVKSASLHKKQAVAAVKVNVGRGLGYRTRRDPNAWKMYLTTFKPAGPSAMPATVHRLSDPLAANRKAKELLEKAPQVFKIIAACESGMKHYSEETGNVLQGRITPGDVGLLQINSLVHGEDALRLGFNVWSIYGNIGYAIKLYIEKGTQPWNSSKKCWGPKIPPHLRLPLPAQA